MNTLLFTFKQGDDPFWKKKPKEKAAKTARPKTKAAKKTTKRKAPERISMELDDDPDEPEIEVELDSLGSLFMHLIDNDTYQEDVEGSQADDVEVIVLSSGSDSLPTQKIHQAIWKVSFSHPLAHLDPTFILKKQQHEARCTTWHSGQKVTSTGLPDTPVRKRRSEVSPTSDTSYPKAGYFRQPLNPSDSNYQVTPPSSSGESTATQLPPLKTVAG